MGININTELLIAIGAALLVMLLCVGGMAIGLFFKRKPIQHCGGAAFEYKGTKIDCPACGATADEECKNPDKPATSPVG